MDLLNGFKDWTRPDTISAFAAAVSLLALVASIASAAYTRTQAVVAKQKAAEEAAAKTPAVEPVVDRYEALGWEGLGFVKLRIAVRNRIDVAVVCETLRLRGPRGAVAIPDWRLPRSKNGYVPFDPPDRAALSTELTIEHDMMAVGTIDEGSRTPMDRIEFDIFVRLPAAVTREPAEIDAALTFRRAGERRAYSEVGFSARVPKPYVRPAI